MSREWNRLVGLVLALAPRMAAPAAHCASTDANTRIICAELLAQPDFDPARLDAGYPATRLRRESPASPARARRIVVGAADGVISDAEVWQQALDYSAHHPVFRRFLRHRFPIPWDEEILARGAPEMLRWLRKQTLTLQSIGDDPARFLAENVEFWRELVARLSMSRHSGGLGLTYENPTEGGPPSLGRVYRDRKANCLRFVLLMMAAARIAKRPLIPLEVYVNGRGQSIEHVRIGIPTADGATGWMAEMSENHGGKSYTGPMPPGDASAPLSEREVLAAYFNAVAAAIDDDAKAEHWLNLALALDPDNYLVLYNKGGFCMKRGDIASAARFLRRSIEVNPIFPLSQPLLNNLSAGSPR